jgi:hypothetical protein
MPPALLVCAPTQGARLAYLHAQSRGRAVRSIDTLVVAVLLQLSDADAQHIHHWPLPYTTTE